MFNFFKKTEPEVLKTIKGTIDRVGFLPNSELYMTYVIKLKEYPIVFTGMLRDHTIASYEAVLGKENDEVTFSCNEINHIDIESFKNISFSLKR